MAPSYSSRSRVRWWSMKPHFSRHGRGWFFPIVTVGAIANANPTAGATTTARVFSSFTLSRILTAPLRRYYFPYYLFLHLRSPAFTHVQPSPDKVLQEGRFWHWC